ncbi:MAG: tRNA (adenosine(37)-N6)-threonylcarbamoyltransferase complex transferase subunit TsaD [Candidatus Electryonea clarkiae]|nr:tRNA (adenosine(37)-N6)-threonylcarbamoyltransferase complex transferase subunit TsaD [Candidatus Electryonea clarkiae]MDP8287254.1 tRNA (adenosine(37)-N6)-threonylcarbamoyltransferase complex transferase subunit TsaD [Candidatus Electryonea clarkiae]
MKTLGIETSCDETGVALVDGGKVIADRVATQEIHSRWGGVVPELASRLHQRTLARMVNEILADTGWDFKTIEAVAVTRGPGLIGALLVGVSYAKGIAVSCDVPFIGVNHLEAHLWSAEAAGNAIDLPALALLVSGGHTELIHINGLGDYKYLGGTLDDAAGEAFDKVGGLLGISYPAGEELSNLALQGNPLAFYMPVARTKQPLDFSFSGLKTAAAREVEKLKTSGEIGWEADLAASFQKAAVSQLVIRLHKALEKNNYKCVVLAGGVAANSYLRERSREAARKHGVGLVIPPIEMCTDNGAMIAWLGERLLVERGTDPLTFEADPNLSLVEV